MGHSLIQVAAWPGITLIPHTATSAKHIGKPVSIGQFAGKADVEAFRRDDNDEYVVRNPANNTFMEGPLAAEIRVKSLATRLNERTR